MPTRLAIAHRLGLFIRTCKFFNDFNEKVPHLLHIGALDLSWLFCAMPAPLLASRDDRNPLYFLCEERQESAIDSR